MNKSPIRSYNDLIQEKQRLTLLLQEKKIGIQAEYEVIKQKLKPLGTVVEVVEKLTTKDKSNPLLNAGIDFGVNILLKKVLLRNAGFIVKLLVPIMTRNFISHEVEEENNIFTKIGGFVKKQFKNKPQQPA